MKLKEKIGRWQCETEGKDLWSNPQIFTYAECKVTFFLLNKRKKIKEKEKINPKKLIFASFCIFRWHFFFKFTCEIKKSYYLDARELRMMLKYMSLMLFVDKNLQALRGNNKTISEDALRWIQDGNTDTEK